MNRALGDQLLVPRVTKTDVDIVTTKNLTSRCRTHTEREMLEPLSVWIVSELLPTLQKRYRKLFPALIDIH